jgi:energy-coupling factor transport system substrate-specific component
VAALNNSDGSCDDAAALLRGLRTAAGKPSYAELVRRVMSQRMARGMSEWEARVGRTTVYDTFRPGRRALDLDLITELVRALHGSDEDLAQCLAGQQSAPASSLPEPKEAEVVVAPPDPMGVPTETELAATPHPRLTPGVRVVFLLGCVALNLAGRVLVNTTHLPLYLDMVGTAVAALLLGPWSGAGVGVATSLAGVPIDGWVSLPFAGVEVVGALIWGYGISRLQLGRTVPRFFLLNVVVAVCCSVVAVPIIVWVDHGVTGSGADHLTQTMRMVWHNLLAAVAAQNLLTSLADKLITGFVALTIIETIPARLVPHRRTGTLQPAAYDQPQALLGARRHQGQQPARSLRTPYAAS